MTIRLWLMLFLFSIAVGLDAAESPTPLSVSQAPKETPQIDLRRQMQQQYQRPQHESDTGTPQAGFRMICPQHADVEIQLSHAEQGWDISPNKIKPETFERAYGQVDKDSKNTVTLACLYRMNTTYTASHDYDGSQQCLPNDSNKKAKVHFLPVGLEGYSTNISATSTSGTLDVINTGQRVDKKNRKLICEFKTVGLAQLFKVHTPEINLSSCRGNSLMVDCR